RSVRVWRGGYLGDNHQTRQFLTCRTIFQLRLSRSPPSGECKCRVLMKAAQQNPLCVRTPMLDVPFMLPLCHQLSALLTSQPCGWRDFAEEGVVMIWIVSGLRLLGGLLNPPTCMRNST